MTKKIFLAIMLLSFLSTLPLIAANDTNLAAPDTEFFMRWGTTTHPTIVNYLGYDAMEIPRDNSFIAGRGGETNTQQLNEYNSIWYPITSGQHILVSAWLATTASSTGCSSAGSGIRLGFDVYGSGGRICEVDTFDGQEGWTGSWSSPPLDGFLEPSVAWNSGWTQVTYSFIVPATYIADGNCGSGYTVNEAAVPGGVIFFVGTANMYPDDATNETGKGYIRDITFQLNPETAVPTATPQPTSNPTATPLPSAYPTAEPRTSPNTNEYASYRSGDTTINPLLILLGVAGMGFVLYEMAWKNGKK